MCIKSLIVTMFIRSYSASIVIVKPLVIILLSPPPRIDSVCHSVSYSVNLTEQDHSKRDQPISLKLGIMIGPTNRKNWLTFGGDSITFSLPSQLQNRDFRIYLLAFLTQVTGRFLRNLAK